jgi:hypothetical protein
MIGVIITATLWCGAEVALKPSEGLALLYSNLDDRVHNQACGKEFVGKPVGALLADWWDAMPSLAPGESKTQSRIVERKFSLSCGHANPTKAGGWSCSLWVDGIEKRHGGLVTWFLTPEKRYMRNRVICNEDND